MYNYLLLVTMIVILLIALRANKYDIMAPSILFVAPLTISAIFCVLYTTEWAVNLNVITYFLIGFGCLCFFLGEQISKVCFRNKNNDNDYKVRLHITNSKRLLILLYEIMSFVIYYRKISSLVSEGGNVYILFDSTYAKTVSEQIGFFVSTCHKISIVFAFLSMLDLIYSWINKEHDKKRYIMDSSVILIYLMEVLITGSRGDIVNFAVSTLFVIYSLFGKFYGWSKKEIKKTVKKLIPGGAVVILGFYLLKNIVKKASQETSTILDVFSAYIGAQIELLDSLIIGNIVIEKSDYFGLECFYNLYQFLQKINLVDKNMPGPIFPYWTFNGIGCNVYTFFKRPYIDFGIWGTFVITFVCGIVFGYFYFKKVKIKLCGHRNLRALIIYSFFVNKVFLAFFDDYITTQMSFTTILMLIFFFILYDWAFAYKLKT